RLCSALGRGVVQPCERHQTRSPDRQRYHSRGRRSHRGIGTDVEGKTLSEGTRTLWQGCQGEIAEDRGWRDRATTPVARGQLCLRVPPSIMEIRDIPAARNPLTFPQRIATHSTEQIFYFDQQGLLSSFRSAGGMSRLTDSNRSALVEVCATFVSK